jgi:hypothetical protein
MYAWQRWLHTDCHRIVVAGYVAASISVRALQRMPVHQGHLHVARLPSYALGLTTCDPTDYDVG